MGKETFDCQSTSKDTEAGISSDSHPVSAGDNKTAQLPILSATEMGQ